MFLLVGGEELRHVVCRDLVHVAGGVEVALRVVEGAVGDAFFGVCAVPGFAEVLCAALATAVSSSMWVSAASSAMFRMVALLVRCLVRGACSM